ncbi:RagB/SusD domain-containing protein [Flavobacterium fluvii]|uniref:RagB/SusD domain-containing protein n=1 Tax=Flavobacterium fluvii TaxID=468056 RepID=A0A1M5ITP4_9FLAO|nr:RagB/SusD family nutrient uptake outer membrane protein [Flavobacterium fluvii]SHG31555.1 RagB/SusD domain-containing protein [Flavobacterium fluvii]
MKKIFKYSILILSISILSCESYLDVESFDKVSDDNVIFDKASSETAVRGAYRSLASLNYSSGFQNTILQSGGDVRSLNNAQTDLNIINYDLRSDIGFLSTYWANFYNTINRANHVIQKVPSVNDLKLTTELRNQLLGEAYFIRAFSYFDLARVYGGVQLFLTPTTIAADKLGVPRSSQAEVYAQVIADLNLAESLLPSTVVRNRATKFTAYALKARVHLYQNKFAEAEIDVNNVLANSGYKLIKPFNLAAGTTESVLEFSYSVNDINSGYSLWNTSNRSLEPKAVLHNLLNDPTVGGGRKILSVKNAAGQFIGGIYPTNISTAYAIRTAELYLIRAEARARKTSPDLTGALSDLNIVRERSGLVNSTAVTKEEILLAIENERRVEFALEPDRWFDLVRTGRAKTVLNITNPDKYIFPIPAGERLADPSLSQNPSY